MQINAKLLIFILPIFIFITSCKDCKDAIIKKPATVETDSLLKKCYEELYFTCNNGEAKTNFLSFEIGTDKICYTEGTDKYSFESTRGSKDIRTGNVFSLRYMFRVKMEPETIWLNSFEGYSPNAQPSISLALDTKEFYTTKEYIEKYFIVGNLPLRKIDDYQPDATEEQPEGTFAFEYECTCGEHPDNNQGLKYVSYPDNHDTDYLKCLENVKEETTTEVIYHIKLAFNVKMYTWQGQKEYWTTFENGSFVFDVKIPK
jgi:hypothetical protein